MEAIRYPMKPDYHDGGMNEEIFPEEADGVIIFLNTERLLDVKIHLATYSTTSWFLEM